MCFATKSNCKTLHPAGDVRGGIPVTPHATGALRRGIPRARRSSSIDRVRQNTQLQYHGRPFAHYLTVDVRAEDSWDPGIIRERAYDYML